jgi:hypothetical protein
MPPFRLWADLPPELLWLIGDSLDLKSYASARGACRAWRRALVTPSPLLLVLDDARCHASATSLPARRSFDLKAGDIRSRGRCIIGSGNGWLALYGGQRMISLFNPMTATEIMLPPLIYNGSKWLSKLVFAPNPAKDDFAAVAICDMHRLAYVTTGAKRWVVLPLRLGGGDQLADIVYHEKGTVYCLTRYGDVHVLRLPEHRRGEPVIVDDPSSVLAIISSMPEHAGLGRQQNALATIEPLSSPSHGNLLFDRPAANFAPPYNRITIFASPKNLVFCGGNLYQIWRNKLCMVTLAPPTRRCVTENEVFVLRYYPQRQPCWEVVTNLGGYSVFVGRNNAVSLFAQDVPGIKGNCVYWIGGERGRDQRGMVFDMATGRSTCCLPTIGVVPGGAPQNAICWYFLNDMVNNHNNNESSDPSNSFGRW